jgi:hypothetical protein
VGGDGSQFAMCACASTDHSVLWVCRTVVRRVHRPSYYVRYTTIQRIMMSEWLWSLTPMYWVAAGVFKRNYTFRYRAVSGDNGPNTAHRGAGVRTTNMSVESPEEHQLSNHRPWYTPRTYQVPGAIWGPYSTGCVHITDIRDRMRRKLSRR